MSGTNIINQVLDFYGKYLCCSREQLDLLALWTLHTHCFENAPFSPALNIHSRHKQSGKTRCLELLDSLCYRSWFHTSPSPALVVRQTQGFDEDNPFKGTLLLDDCRFSTVLQGVLSASFRWYGAQVTRGKNEQGDWDFERHPTFFPKAFAGNGRLPDCLRDISIPIALEPKTPDFPCRRFKIGYEPLYEISFTLRNKLYQWGLEHASKLINNPPYEPSQFPPELTSRQQDCAEPLLQIADLIGGEWPQRARVALVNAFALSAFEDFYASKQLLTDIYDLFKAKGNPGWLSTKDVLESLHVLDDRNWDEWSKGKPLTSKDLSALLAPFGIKSKNHRAGNDKDKVIKGYSKEDFLEKGQRHIPQELFRRSKSEMAITSTADSNEGTNDFQMKPVAADSQNQSRSAAGGFTDSSTAEVKAAPGCDEGTKAFQTNAAVANKKNSSPSHVQPVASSQKPVAISVAANSQNTPPATASPGCIEETQGSRSAVAADSQGPKKPEANTKPKIIIATKVYAGQQHKPEYIYAED